MSFDPTFERRFTDVIAPAIEDLSVGDQPLETHRVDRSVISDSIIAEIVEGVSTDIAVLVDLSTIGYLDGRPIRNANVLYELGLAHAIRRPEHVLAFRSDADSLLFDVAGIRVHSYDPDGDPQGARKQVSEAIVDSLGFSRRLNRHIVEHSVRSIDPISLAILMRVYGLPSLGKDFEDLRKAAVTVHLLPSFQRLLDLQLLQLEPVKAMSAEKLHPVGLSDLYDFQITALGREVAHAFLHRTGIWEGFAVTTPGIAEWYEQWKHENSED